jgi:hypothetical protein
VRSACTRGADADRRVRTSRRARALLALACALFTVAGGSAGAATLGHFKTPSHNVVCDYAYGSAEVAASVVCSIKSGLKPPPPRTVCHGGDPTDHVVVLPATGHAAEPTCAGDPGPLIFEHSARVLAYGHTWRHGHLRCTSKVKGLRCTNARGHGFFLSRTHSYRF